MKADVARFGQSCHGVYVAALENAVQTFRTSPLDATFQRLMEKYLALSAAADVDLPALEVDLPLAHGFPLCSYATAPPA